MSKIINTIFLHDGYAEIIVERTGYQSYKNSVLVDIEDLPKLGKIRISNEGYAYQCNRESKSVAHIVMNHESNLKTVVDHINNNRLDNRKTNLRIISQRDNANNRGTTRNNTGIVGITLCQRGGYKYYKATISDRKTLVHGKAVSATKRYCKQFNVNRMGKQKAFEAAQDWLKLKRKEFGYLDS